MENGYNNQIEEGLQELRNYEKFVINRYVAKDDAGNYQVNEKNLNLNPDYLEEALNGSWELMLKNSALKEFAGKEFHKKSTLLTRRMLSEVQN